MMIGAKDRSYYRAMPNKELIEEAKYYPSIELCIVLGERLLDQEREPAYCPYCDKEVD